MSVTKERFFRATLELAGPGSIKQRLMGAYKDHLVDIDPELLPRSAREKFVSLSEQMTRVRPINGEGPIFATVRKMSEEQADQAAEIIVNLFAQVSASRDRIKTD